MARLLVSIPPVLRGEAFVDSPSDSFQRQLIDSWLQSGFRPVSLNTATELQAHSGFVAALEASGVEILEVPCSKIGFPAYLPNLRSSLRLAIERFPGEVIAITNADIHISLEESVARQLATLRPDRFLLSHRTDVRNLQMVGLSIADRRRLMDDPSFLPGIDFVAARAEALEAALPYLGDELTIGLPWWDLLLPMALFSAGATKQHLDSVQFLHLVHADRWEPHWLSRIGVSATHHLCQAIEGFRAPVTAFIWSLAYRKLRSPVQSPRVLFSRLRMDVEALRGSRHGPVYLMDVLRMTEGLVCEPGWSLDQRWVSAWQKEPPL